MPRKAKDELELEQAQPKSEEGLYAYADFSIKVGDDVIDYPKGAKFDVPHGWKRDLAAEELMQASRRKNKDAAGLVFVYLGKVINPEEKNMALRERQVHTAALPLEER